MKNWKPQNKNEEKTYKLFLKSNKINKLLKNIKGSTYTNYRINTRDFFIWKNTDPEIYLQDPRKMSRSDEIDYKDQLEEDINDYISYLQEKPKIPSGKTFAVIKTSIKRLLEKNRIDLGESFWKELHGRLPSAKPITEKETPSREQLSKILNFMNINGRALYIVQMTSGSRINEILNLTFENIQLKYDYPRIKVSHINSKNGKLSLKRITPEAKDILLQYLSIREQWLRSKLKIAGIKDEDQLTEQIKNEERIFPMSKSNANDIWNNALKKSKLFRKDSDSDKVTMGSHSLRRYFKKHFIKSHGEDGKFWANVFMNKGNETDIVYDQYTDDEISEEYSKGTSGLTIFKIPIDTDQRIIKLKDELDSLKKTLGLEIRTSDRGTFLIDKETLSTQYSITKEKPDEEKDMKSIGISEKEQFKRFQKFLKKEKENK